MDYWLLILGGVAVWRVSRMLFQERGPLDVFARLRARLAKGQKRMGGLYDLISCFYCITVWASFIPAAILAHNYLYFVLYLLVMSGIASIIHELLTKRK